MFKTNASIATLNYIILVGKKQVGTSYEWPANIKHKQNLWRIHRNKAISIVFQAHPSSLRLKNNSALTFHGPRCVDVAVGSNFNIFAHSTDEMIKITHTKIITMVLLYS
jgi:hypothetical protein